MPVTVGPLSIADAPAACEMVQRLLLELGEEGEESGTLSVDRISSAWRQWGDRFLALAARDDVTGDVVGIATVEEAFAIYANGVYGIINEMYVVPGYRSSGIGGMLIQAVEAHGRRQGWSRVDVTAPESDRWHRTRRFYERQGFAFAGPKFKLWLRSGATST